MNLAIGIGDIYLPLARQVDRPQPRVQYGVRIEANRFLTDVPRNDAAFDALGIATNRLPRFAAIAPMVGFSIPVGSMPRSAGFASPNRGTVFGGIREYRGMLSPATLDRYARQTGLETGASRMLCAGPAVPTVDWATFVETPAAIPSRCHGEAMGVFADSARSISFFGPGYALTRSLRAELGGGGFLGRKLWGAIQATRIRNRGLSDFVDRNFDPQVRFTVPGEAHRPVFVAHSAIDPSTGVMLLAASRRAPVFGPVLETRSDLGQDLWQVTGTLSRTFGGLSTARMNSTHGLSYTFKSGREDVRGFSTSTAGDPRTIERAPLGQPRHTVSYSASATIPRWGTFSGLLGGASSSRFTPLVWGDLNGDGLSNDRPFVFDPDRTADPELRTGLGTLLTAAPGSARKCLMENLGRIAPRNACLAPPRAWLNLSFSPDPYLVRLGNRGTLTLVATNVLGGLDVLMHGPSRAKGWGASGMPDATLLALRGFDPATQRFRYAVNPAFGSVSAARSMMASPITLSVNLQLDLGPDRETKALTAFLAAAKQEPTGALTAAQIRTRLDQASATSRLAAVLRMRDSLVLSDAQIDSIQGIVTSFQRLKDREYDLLARTLAEKRGDVTGDKGRREWHATLAALIRAEVAAWSRMRSLLTAEQYRRLPPSWTVDDDISGARLDRVLRGPLVWPP